jgi:ankyrin repeat protein/mono/diheme cytochrome c family protein
MIRILLAFLTVLLPATAVAQLPPAATGPVDYDADVRPILAQNCYSCHGERAQQSGLRLDRRQPALRGGDYGPVIVPGDSASSKLIKRLVDGDGGMQMPPAGPLSPHEIGILRAWIDRGAEFRNDVAEAAPKPVDPRVSAFIAAVRRGPRAAVQALAAADASIVLQADAAGSTPLHHAAGFGSLETMTWLLERGADVNAKNRLGSTPLHWAIHDEAKVRLLLSRGAAVNARQLEGRTPLYLAASLGNGHATLRLLLERGADPNLATAPGQTPLMAASLRADVRVMTTLLEHGAAVNHANGAGETALMLAAASGASEPVALLLARGADARMRTKRQETALGNAATTGNEQTVRLLLDAGAEVNVRNIRGFSPLMLAAGSDTVPAPVVKLLIAHGAETSYTGDYDETAHDLAAKRGDTDVVRLLASGSTKGGSPAVAPGAGSARPASIPDAVERALALTVKQSYTFIRVGGCNSCHSQDLPSAAAAFARARGLRAPADVPQLPASMLPPPERVMDFGIVAIGGLAWELFDDGMNGVAANAFTDAGVRLLKAMQLPEGNWSSNESRRPPMSSGDYQTAALAVYALKQYGRPAEDPQTRDALARAAAWFERSRPQTTQDRAFHLLGLGWAGMAPDRLKTAATELAAMQRGDGGWSQLPGLESDAYATGQVLFALNTAAAMPVSDPVYRKGVEQLLRTQAADGSWHVKSRAIWLQPYFESGFPYGQDQFISTAGTAWAAMALAAAAPRAPVTVQR